MYEEICTCIPTYMEYAGLVAKRWGAQQVRYILPMLPSWKTRVLWVPRYRHLQRYTCRRPLELARAERQKDRAFLGWSWGSPPHTHAKPLPLSLKTNGIASPCPKLHVLFDFISSFHSNKPAVVALHLQRLQLKIRADLPAMLLL